MELKLFNKNFIFLLTGHAFALFGHYLLMFALPFYVLHATGSPAIFGTISAIAFLPMIIMSPIGGIVADRVNKKRVIVIMYLSISALIFLFIWASGFMSAIPIIVMLMMGVYALESVPAVDASVPQIVPESQIVRASGMVSLAGQVPEFVAPIVAGLLFVSFGLIPIVVICAICYVLAGTMGLFIKIPHVKQEVTASIPSMIKNDVQTTVKFLCKDNPHMLKIIMTFAILGLFMLPMLPIGLPILITGYLGMSSEMLGLAMGIAIGLGGIISGIVASIVGDKLKMKDGLKLLLLSCLAILPIGVVLWLGLNLVVTFVIIVASTMVIMITVSLFMIRLFGYIQVETPEEIMGKVISAVTVLAMFTHPLGFFLYGIMFERLYNMPWVVLFFVAVISLGIIGYSARYFRQIK